MNSCAFNSATQLTASLTINSTATLGSRNVSVTNPDSQSSTLSNAFSVRCHFSDPESYFQPPACFRRNGHAHPAPGHRRRAHLDRRSELLAPGYCQRDGRVRRRLHARSGDFDARTARAVPLYSNFYYARSTAGGATSLTLNFSTGTPYVLAAVAEVAGLNPSAPLDQSGYKDSLTATAAWSSAAVTTTAANEYLFSWAGTEASNTFCSSPGSGWTLESQTNDFSGATVCLLDRVVSATGSYQASVTAGSAQTYAMEIVTFSSGPSSQPPPVLSSVNPNSGAQGQNLTSVILTGSNFQTSATCNFGAGITVNSCAFNSATQLTASISIGSTATTGARSVTVTNPDSQASTLSSGFTVTAATQPPPTLTLVNPNSGAQGQNLTSVILTGSNFQSGATCNFGAGITVNSCAFNSATQLTASISISSTATTGARSVTVTNSDSQSSTLASGFTVPRLASRLRPP